MIQRNYVALGDSISTGYGLQEKEKAFTNRLAKSRKSEQNYHNYAVNGNTSDDLVKRFTEEEVKNNIKNADIITITIGGNDILHLLQTYKELCNIEFIISINDFEEVLDNPVVLLTIKEALKDEDLQTPFDQMLENYETNLEFIIRKIKLWNKDARIFIQTVYNPGDGVPKFEVVQNFIDYLITSINQIILNHQEGNYDVIDTYHAFKGKSEEMTRINVPDIHPSEKGHLVIYQMIYDKVKEDEPISVRIYE